MYCKYCDRHLPDDMFWKRTTPRGVVPRTMCKECERAQKRRKWAEKHPPRPVDPEKERIKCRREEKRLLKSQGKKRCTLCGEIKFLLEFQEKRAQCRECHASKKEADKLASGYYDVQRIREERRIAKAEKMRISAEKTAQRRALREQGLKQCPHCGRILPEDMFFGTHHLASWCKDCSADTVRDAARRRRVAKKEHMMASLHTCVQCGNNVPWEDFRPNVKKCRACIEANKIERRELERTNKQKRKAQRVRERVKEDGAYRLQRRISENLRNILKGKKALSSSKWTGCTKAFLREHIASQFRDGMSWDNYGEWHLDHYVPIAYFDRENEADMKICWNYRNLRPLWASDNIAKADSLPEDYEDHLRKIKDALFM